MKTQFKTPAKFKRNAMILTIIGVVTLVFGMIFLMTGDAETKNRFWATLMQNSIYFLLMSVASAFILAASNVAQGAWIVAYRRIPEAIAANVWKFGIIAIIVLFTIVLTNNTGIYSWLDPAHTEHFPPLKKFFLSKPFFIVWTLFIIAGWAFFGNKFRQLSLQQDKMPHTYRMNWISGKWSAAFIVLFGLSVGSTIPWLWIMSIDSHWFSTMFSWYNFASSFVSGMSVMLLFVLYVKKQGYLEYVNDEHFHDMGKIMFAFSIFWTYLWFSQFMLIWYANISEETIYFVPRLHGPYKFFFYLNLVLNFISPILILMSRTSKRNYFTLAFMAVLIIIGHWVDYYQMIMPGVEGSDWKLGWFEIGIPLGFVGMMMLAVSRTLETAPIVPENNPYMKESIMQVS